MSETSAGTFRIYESTGRAGRCPISEDKTDMEQTGNDFGF
jgi:hypothetical protein